ncbi:zinc-ribbon domain-containing protein [Ligilactobacillus pobuzihii]|uniref:zinc ribbon domain-containing protein n=1 Tax=Ligilactobacillus pobuzihii TaxID=449659 RepID=UPI0019D01E6A|nr:zinc ribbon domain-containing protein [Ligilactobacillus pobuzihii]MBN7274626.1 zinc-ribbon domain-containing protein [Ligilactobacillus pobuzihii]
MSEKTKYCTNCGQQLNAQDKFCPYCGSKQPIPNQPVNVSSNDRANSNESPSIPKQFSRYNLNVSIPEPKSVTLGGDFKKDRILKYRESMGFTKMPNIMVYTQNNYYKKMLLIGAYGIMFNKNNILCIEDDGLLLIGINGFNHFNGKNSFIPSEKINSIYVSSIVGVQLSITIMIDGKNMNLLAPKVFAHCPWQKENVNKLRYIY